MILEIYNSLSGRKEKPVDFSSIIVLFKNESYFKRYNEIQRNWKRNDVKTVPTSS